MQFQNAQIKAATSDIIKASITISFTVPLNAKNLEQAEALAQSYSGKDGTSAAIDINPLQPSLLENKAKEEAE